MAKSKKIIVEGNTVSGSAEDILEVLQSSIDKDGGKGKAFKIMEASIKDDFCDYSYEILNGIGKGRTHKVAGNKGGLTVHDDMKNAFAELNVHLACIDDVFKNSKVKYKDIDEVKSHEHTFNYTVTGIKIKGGEGDESVILIGSKYISSASGPMDLNTPKYPIDTSSSYKWYNELKQAIDRVRLEVERYDAGKGIKVNEDEPELDPKQTSMSFEKPEGEDDLFDKAQ